MPKIFSKEKAFKEGRQAAGDTFRWMREKSPIGRELIRHDCQYPPDTMAYREWHAGFHIEWDQRQKKAKRIYHPPRFSRNPIGKYPHLYSEVYSEGGARE